MASTNLAKEEMLNGLNVNYIQLHSGDPTATSTAAVIPSTNTACTFAAASAGSRALSATVEGINVPAGTVSHFSVWNGDPQAGGSLRVYKQFDSAEVYASPGLANVTNVTFNLSDVV